MDITQTRKRGKKEPEDVLQQPLKDIHIDSLKKIKPIKIPGTSMFMPPFDYDDPNVCLWIIDRIDQLRKKNPILSYEEFLALIAEKIEFSDDEKDFFIDENDLLIENGKICALPLNWEKQMEKNYEKGRRFWETKLQRMNSVEMDKLIEIKIALMKENKNLSPKKALDMACRKILAQRKK